MSYTDHDTAAEIAALGAQALESGLSPSFAMASLVRLSALAPSSALAEEIALLGYSALCDGQPQSVIRRRFTLAAHLTTDEAARKRYIAEIKLSLSYEKPSEPAASLEFHHA